MSSNGSRGNYNPNGRYGGDRYEYTDYGKVRKKNYYSSSSRRDFRAQLSGANKIALTGPIRDNDSTGHTNNNNNNNNNNGSYASNGISRSNSSGSIPTLSAGQHQQLQAPSSSASTSSYSTASYGSSGNNNINNSTNNNNSNSYYGGYGGYNSINKLKQNEPGDYGPNNNFYGGRGSGSSTHSNEPWGNRGKASASRGSSLTSTDYRKERYEYSDPLPNGTSKWKSSYGNRSSLSGSLGGRSYSKWGAYSSFGGSKGTGSSALVNSTGGSKRNINLTPGGGGGGRGSYTNLNSKFSVDRYSTARSKDYVKKKSPRESSKDYHIDERKEDNRSNKNNNNNTNIASGMNDNLRDDNDNDNELDAEAEANLSKLSQDGDMMRHYDDKDVDMDDLEGIEGDIMDEDEEDMEEDDDDNDNEGHTSIVVEELKQYDEVLQKKKELVINSMDSAATENDDEVLYYPEGCNYPLNKLESSYVELEKEYKAANESLKYSLVKPVESLSVYPFYKKNLKAYDVHNISLAGAMKAKLLLIRKKRLSLWKDYEKTFEDYTISSEKMDQQLRVIHPSDDEMRREIDSSDSKKVAPEFDDSYYAKPPPTTSRRSRRHGDLVTTEAEFEEVLKSLERQSDEDPLLRAQKVAAQIPDMILDPIERNCFIYMDSNNAVQDVEAWANRITYDFDTNFLEKEHALFTEGFCHHPKRYGAISRFMGGLRTPEDCVHYYYKTKKNVNYKQILIQHKKKASKRSVKRGGKGRSRNSSQVHTSAPPPQPPVEKEKEVEDEKVRNNSVVTPVFTQEHGSTNVPDTITANSTISEPQSETSPKGDEVLTSETVKSHTEEGQDKNKLDRDEYPDKLVNRKRIRKEDNTETTTGTKVFKKDPVAEDQKITTISNNDDSSSKRSISSYWSINEVTQFPSLLEAHGTKWVIIADILGTKTPTMVKNYYQRNADKNGWSESAIQSPNNTTTELYDKYPPPPPVTTTELAPQLPTPIDVAGLPKPPPLTTTSFVSPSPLPHSSSSFPIAAPTSYPPMSSAAAIIAPTTDINNGSYPIVPVTPQVPTRSTIMSLLNGPSPVKPDSVPPQNTGHKSNVRNLLN